MFKKPLFIACIAFMIAFNSLHAHAAEIEWRDCVGCHAERGEASNAPFVDVTILEGSVHRNLECADCHADVHEVTHVVGQVPHQRYPEEVSCTDRCHVEGNTEGAPDFSPMEQYKDSVHGVAERAGLADVAACRDCHGRHNIRPKDDPKSTVYRANIPLMCAACHENMQVVIKHHIHAEKPFQEYKQSVHGKALYKDGLIAIAAVCTDCHGVHDIRGVGDEMLMADKPQTCGKCHIGIYNVYEESIHGRAYLKDGIMDAPTCSGCHGEHNIAPPTEPASRISPENVPKTCSSCHEEAGIMARYDIPTNRLETYRGSFHGIAQSFGTKSVANCASCHGYHDILPSSDPQSSIYPANLAETCGKPECHPGMPSNISTAKMHVDVKVKESGAIYYVRQVFIWLVGILIVVSIIWVVPDIVRKFRRKNVQ